MAWKLKTLQNGNFEVKDGKPVFVDEESGLEVAFDYTEHVNKVHSLNEENKQTRIKFEDKYNSLKQFEGLSFDDIKKNADAAKTLENIEALKKGELDKLSKTFQASHEEEVRRITAAAAEREKELLGQVSERDQRFNQLTLDNAFERSQFLKERAGTSVSLIRSHFAPQFKVEENGTIYGVDANGNKILSKKRVTEVAPFDEALQILAESHPDKDMFLKPIEKSGGGMNPGGRFSGPEATKVAAVANRFADPKMTPEQKLDLLNQNGMWGFGGTNPQK
jgi:hypothetical protein